MADDFLAASFLIEHAFALVYMNVRISNHHTLHTH